MGHGGLLDRDPKGYWAVLGLSPGADTAAVKAAYRRRAKQLHPDRNPHPRAREEFVLLGEAYRVLGDERLRAAYAAAARRPRQGRPEPPPEPEPQPAPSVAPVACRACGRIPAQPRYVVLPTVQGRLFTTRLGTVEGVYCRRCADGAALATALSNWVFGWWSFPMGPIRTIGALLTTLRGGHFPRDRNFHLLLRQSRAFLARQDRELARAVALQARAYASSDEERQDADALLRAARDSRPGRNLKNRWLDGSWLRMAQLGPPVTVATVFLAVLGTWTNVNLWGVPVPETAPSYRPGPNIAGLQRPLLLRTGQIYEVTAPRLIVRDGPDDDAKALLTLETGTAVLVTENAPRTGWVHILTADGETGFVAGRYLTPGLANDPLDGVFLGRGMTDGKTVDQIDGLLGGGMTDSRHE